jgi:dTDP-4-amino-4,6-dideoxygalactose transaminase
LLASSNIGLPLTAADRAHIYYVYVIRSAERDTLQRRLAEHEIDTGVHFPIPIHLQPATRALGYRAGDLPHTEQASKEVLSIPMYAELSPDQQEWVASCVKTVPAYVTISRSNVPDS